MRAGGWGGWFVLEMEGGSRPRKGGGRTHGRGGWSVGRGGNDVFFRSEALVNASCSPDFPHFQSVSSKKGR